MNPKIPASVLALIGATLVTSVSAAGPKAQPKRGAAKPAVTSTKTSCDGKECDSPKTEQVRTPAQAPEPEDFDGDAVCEACGMG